MHLVLNEEVDQWHYSPKEGTRQVLPQLNRLRVGWAHHETANGPWQGRYQVADHEDIMPIVVVGARDICPTTTGQSPEHAHTSNPLGTALALPVDQAVEQEDQQEAGTGTYRNEDLEDGSLGIAIPNSRGDGREPFDRVAEVLILDNLLVVECDADNEGTEESGVGSGGMGVGDPLAGDLGTNACQLRAQFSIVRTAGDSPRQRRRHRDVWEALWLLQRSSSRTKEGKDRGERKTKRQEEE